MIHSQRFSSELAAAVSVAVLGLPLAIGFGIFAFAPLGDQAIAFGISAGLVAAAAAPLVMVLLGSNSPVIFAPRSVTSYVINGVVAGLSASTFAAAHAGDLATLLAAIALVLAVASILQAALAALGLAEYVKYVPYPVLSGFQNAAAVLLLLSQLTALIGVERPFRWGELGANLAALQPLTLAVGAVTIACALWGKRWVKRVPPVLLGLAAGSALYYACVAAGLQAHLGKRLGDFDVTLSLMQTLAAVPRLAGDPDFLALLPAMFGWAASLAFVWSLDALLCFKLAESITGERMPSGRELARLGVTNTLVTAAGGIASAASVSLTQANFSSGGRTRVSQLAAGAGVLAAGFLVTPAVAMLPRVVIAGLLVATAVRLIDPWAFDSLRQGRRAGARARRLLAVDLAVMLLVMLVGVFGSILAAVAIGVVLSIGLLLGRLRASWLRRVIDGNDLTSRQIRDGEASAFLRSHAAALAVIELQGTIFFAAAEAAGDRIAELARGGKRTIIVDLRHVVDIDSTAARVLANTRAGRTGATVLFAGLTPGSRPAVALHLAGIPPAATFIDLDRALEAYETRLLATRVNTTAEDAELAPAALDLLAGLDAVQLARVLMRLDRRHYAAGARVFAQGDSGEEIYAIVRGRASVIAPLDGDRSARLVTYHAGTVVGEVAWLDRGTRTADVYADTDLIALALSRPSFEAITREDPAVGTQILGNVARRLSARVRHTTRVAVQLAQ